MKKILLGLIMAFAITACSPQANTAPKADSKCPCCQQVDADGKLSAGGKQCCMGMKGGKMSTGTPCSCCMEEGKICDKSHDKKAAKPAAKKAAPAKAAAPAAKADDKSAADAKDAKPAEKK